MASPPSSRRLRTRSERDRAAHSTKSKFDKLRRLRAAGRSATALDDEDSEGDMYVSMDEDEYQQSKAAHLDDFVVDDDGGGYVDDDIGTAEPSKKQTKLASTRGTKTSSQTPTSSKPKRKNIGAMLQSAQMRAKPREEKPSADDDQFLSSLISGLDVPLTPSRPSSKRRQQTPASSASYSVRRRAAAAKGMAVGSPSPALAPVGVVDISGPDCDPFAASPPTKRVRMEDPFADPVVKTEPGVVEPTVKTEDLDGLDDAMLLDGLEDLQPATEMAPLYPDAEQEEHRGRGWMDVQMEMSKQPTTLVKQENAVSDTHVESGLSSTVHLFWLDILEKSGSLYLIGKTLAGGVYGSCCVKVSGVERNVFVLPRINPETGERFTALDVHREFENLAMRAGVRSFGCKPVERKYAFELAEVPATTEYLKVIYGFDQPALPDDLSGQTFERVFGTTYSALELFLLKRRMMGPCWLEIQNAEAADTYGRLSWCRQEFRVDGPKNIRVLEADRVEKLGLARTPPLTTMTLSLKTVMNHKDNANEIVAVSLLVHRDVQLDDQTPAERRSAEQYTVVRQLTGVPLPADFGRAAQGLRGTRVEIVKTEGALLNYLVAQLTRIDPDVLAAHNFYGFDLDVLLHRMRKLATRDWSRLGRLSRTQWPKLQAGSGGMGESTYGERQIVAGRIVCDTYLASKDLIRAKSFSLTNLASQELQIRREEIPFERIPECFGKTAALLHFVRHTAFDAYLAAALMFRLQALPLTRQLTALAGNLWSRTLMGARAERNEFLLLHEFYRNKFIRPDKYFGGGPRAQLQKAGEKGRKPAVASLSAEMAEAIDSMDNDAEGQAVQQPEAGKGTSGRRKPAYLGGLVLEPKRGFYDRFVLLLDFNSLYPSIIQEFNICFTTVQRSSGDDVPDLPSPDLPSGILPRLLKTLVERRRQVKQMLKRASGDEAAQLDVRQKALKLTANSMYGCLGFTHSRFYAKPLAMLITARGREILQATRDLALTEGLEVIYGDTDSIMIATRTEHLREVYEMGAQFKRKVNERYRLLELDIDGVFKRLLLLKKKKYAALQVTSDAHAPVVTTKLETKGLDLVRRDWCGLSHDVSDYVLKQLFADAPQPVEGEMPMEQDESAVIAQVHEHLTRVGHAVRQAQVPLDKYAIHKALAKPPEAYPNKAAQPHVLVALQMRARGEAVRAGDTIPYIICDAKSPALAQCASEDSQGYAARARHPDEVRGSKGGLVPDFEWYLNQQVLPPCARLLEPLEGTDMAHMAQCLGLDAQKYRSVVHSTSGGTSNGELELRTLDSQIPDSERFKYSRAFSAKCMHCQKLFDVEGIARKAADSTFVSGLLCTHCGKMPPPASLATQLAMLIRRCIREYYMFVMQCDEPSCALRTRHLSLSGSRCPLPQCSGTLTEVYSDKLLYHQLQYFASLFSLDRSSVRLETTAAEIRPLLELHQDSLLRLAQTVDSYLGVSARKFVDLAALFSFCTV